jgi:glycosyltransferase involved in cell wall biosynthesis
MKRPGVMINMTKVLVLSYHYPPCAYGCSIRVVNFVKFLPQFGFRPVVLTAEPEYYKDYAAEDYSHQPGMPADIEVVRTASWEPRTKLGSGLASNSTVDQGWPARMRGAVFGPLQRLGNNLLVPDVQILWAPCAVKSGKELLASPDIRLIFAVAPPFSVLLVAYWLKKLTGKRLVLDFKDIWVGRNQHEHRSRLCGMLSGPLERKVIEAADRVVINTDYSYRNFVTRYPQHKDKFLIIPNGYEPRIAEMVKDFPPESTEQPEVFTIVHSGTVDTDRNPEGFIYAVKELRDEYPEFAAKVKVCFSGKVHHIYTGLIKELGLEDVFAFRGYLNYEQNIKLLNSASLLLLLTTHDAPDAIPGKVYEYFALKKPILAITEDGATKDLLLSLDGGKVVHPQDRPGIKHALWELYQAFRQGKLSPPSIPLERFSRRSQTKELARVFNQLVA